MKLVSLFCLLVVNYVGFAQKTIPGSFKIINNTHPENEAFYITSIGKAEIESYRLRDKEVTLQFENGFECALMSAKDLYLTTNNVQINPETYKEKFPATYNLPRFNILQSGLVTAEYPKKNKRKNSIR